MTAFVAVCFTLTAPYVFKIAKSFLLWLIGLLKWMTREWNNTHSAVPSSSSSSVAESQILLGQAQQEDYGTHKKPQNQILLGQGQQENYGTSKKPQNRTKSSMPEGQHSDGNPRSAVQSQSDDHRVIAGPSSEGHGPQNGATSSDAESY